MPYQKAVCNFASAFNLEVEDTNQNQSNTIKTSEQNKSITSIIQPSHIQQGLTAHLFRSIGSHWHRQVLLTQTGPKPGTHRPSSTKHKDQTLSIKTLPQQKLNKLPWRPSFNGKDLAIWAVLWIFLAALPCIAWSINIINKQTHKQTTY